MTAAALGDNQRIGDGNAIFHDRRGRLIRASSRTAAATAALRVDQNRESEKKRHQQSHIIGRLDYDSAFYVLKDLG